jgi:hypothetical protein
MQKVSELTEDMIKYLENKRSWVRNHYAPGAESDYDTVAGKLNLLDTIIKSNWIEKSETYNLQSLGITLGDVIAQDLNFVWVEVTDDYGNDPALQLPDTILILFPMTMISKRIEDNQEVDIYKLYNELREKVNEIKHDAQ